MAAWNTQPVTGRREELVSCPSADTGVFQALKDAGVDLVISGHDHDNNFCAMHEGVQLCYGCAGILLSFHLALMCVSCMSCQTSELLMC